MSTLTTDSMDAETLTALRGSIAKWQAIIDGTGMDDGCENCPLCHKFNREWLGTDEEPEEDHDGPWNCLGCPVAKATNKDHCAGSPYQAYCSESRSMADAARELIFLKSLLPSGVES